MECNFVKGEQLLQIECKWGWQVHDGVWLATETEGGGQGILRVECGGAQLGGQQWMSNGMAWHGGSSGGVAFARVGGGW